MRVNGGSMPVTVTNLVHGIPISEEGRRSVSTLDSKLMFLSDYIKTHNRWLAKQNVSNLIVKLSNIVGYGSGGLYYASIGDLIIWISIAVTLLITTVLGLFTFYYILRGLVN